MRQADLAWDPLQTSNQDSHEDLLSTHSPFCSVIVAAKVNSTYPDFISNVSRRMLALRCCVGNNRDTKEKGHTTGHQVVQSHSQSPRSGFKFAQRSTVTLVSRSSACTAALQSAIEISKCFRCAESKARPPWFASFRARPGPRNESRPHVGHGYAGGHSPLLAKSVISHYSAGFMDFFPFFPLAAIVLC